MATEGHRKFWEEFIKLYKNLPCLWDSKTKEYSDKNLRSAGLETLVRKCKEINPAATKDFVSKKIHNFRCSFRREYKKMRESPKQSYVPGLWYFDMLSFITDAEITKPCEDNDSEESSHTGVNIKRDDFNTLSEQPDHAPPLNPVFSIKLGKRRRSDVTEKEEFTSNSKQNDHNNINNGLHFEPSVMNPNNRFACGDQFDVAGRKFAYDLREINERQRIFAEKLISEVIFHAKLGLLHEHSSVNVNAQTPAESADVQANFNTLSFVEIRKAS